MEQMNFPGLYWYWGYYDCKKLKGTLKDKLSFFDAMPVAKDKFWERLRECYKHNQRPFIPNYWLGWNAYILEREAQTELFSDSDD